MAVVALLTASSCTNTKLDADQGSPTSFVIAPPTTAGEEGAPVASDSVLAGIKGTVTSWEQNDGFRQRMLTFDPTASDFASAASGYDAMILAAIAAESARSDAPGRIASNIVPSTSTGTLCIDFASCRSAALRNSDLDFDGVSGPLAFDSTGMPTQAEFVTVTFNSAGEPVRNDPIGGQLRNAPGRDATDPRFGPLPDGVLRIGTLLPTTGSRGPAAQSALAGVRLAVDELNGPLINGVLGRPVEVVTDTSGAGTAEEIRIAAEALVEAGVDVVIGSVDQSTTNIALPILSAAGIVLISPLDPTAESVVLDPRGLYFRTTATHDLSGRVLGQMASYEGTTSMLIIVGDTPNDAVIADNVTAAFNELDGVITARIDYPVGASPVDIAAFAAGSAPAAVTLAVQPDRALGIIEAMAAAGAGPSAVPWYVAPWLTDGSAADALRGN